MLLIIGVVEGSGGNSSIAHLLGLIWKYHLCIQAAVTFRRVCNFSLESAKRAMSSANSRMTISRRDRVELSVGNTLFKS